MAKDRFLTIFSYLSKIIIIVPLLVIAVILFMKISQQAALAPEKIVLSPTPMPSPSPTSTSQIKLDLQGPFTCFYSTNEATVSAYIKNKNVFAKIDSLGDSSSLLVKGDCLYTWKETTKKGEKMCRIGNLLSLFETLSQFNLVDITKAFDFLPKNEISKELRKNSFNLEKTVNSCKRQEVQDAIFQLPTGVSFKTVEQPGLF